MMMMIMMTHRHRPAAFSIYWRCQIACNRLGESDHVLVMVIRCHDTLQLRFLRHYFCCMAATDGLMYLFINVSPT